MVSSFSIDHRYWTSTNPTRFQDRPFRRMPPRHQRTEMKRWIPCSPVVELTVSPESRWDLWIWKWQPEASRGHGQLLLPPVKVYRSRMIQNVSKNTRLVVLEETSVMSQNKMVCFACFHACWSAEIPLDSLNSKAVDLATLARGTGKLPKKWMQVREFQWWIWSKVSDLHFSTSHVDRSLECTLCDFDDWTWHMTVTCYI